MPIRRIYSPTKDDHKNRTITTAVSTTSTTTTPSGNNNLKRISSYNNSQHDNNIYRSTRSLSNQSLNNNNNNNNSANYRSYSNLELPFMQQQQQRRRKRKSQKSTFTTQWFTTMKRQQQQQQQSLYRFLLRIICGIICFIILIIVPYNIISSVLILHDDESLTGDHRTAAGIFSRKFTIKKSKTDHEQTDDDNNIIYYKRQKEAKRNLIERNVTLPNDWKRGPLAIFYNIYIPNNNIQSDIDDALDIVQEQLQQVVTSPILQEPLTLYYTILGNIKIGKITIPRLCKELNNTNLHCKLLKAQENGSERLTLEELHSFCLKYTHYRVTYIHSKGTFHPSEKNTYWRRLLTAAAVHPHCVKPPNITCNLCGIQFFTQFTFFIPGNMWTASCDYISELIVPFDSYYKLHEEYVQKVLWLKLHNQLKNTLLWDQLDYMGMDRYADEHWVGSHHNVIPCDMDPVGWLQDVFDGILKITQLHWGMGPRNEGIVGGINDKLQDIVRNNTLLSRREVLYLPGLLVKWYTLYGTAPNRKSWVWDFFPDGDYWYNGVQKYGKDVIEKLTEPYRISMDGSRLQSSFAPVVESKLDDSINFENNNGKYTIFYHIAIPNHRDGTGREENTISNLQEVIKMVKDQLDIVKNSVSMSSTIIYFTVAGQEYTISEKKEITDITRLVLDYCSDFHNIQCQSLPRWDKNYEGETLNQLHQFCQLHPSKRVSYIHNLAPMQLRGKGENEKLIRHLTMAAVNRHCLEPSEKNCNACGLIFYTLWTFMFHGNMFAASCDYINKLLPPKKFEEEMNQYVQALLLRRLRGQITTKLFRDRLDYFGVGRYSIDHWLGSHPSILPCDLSDGKHDIMYWRRNDFDTNAFNWSMAPRQKGAPMDIESSKVEKVLQEDGLRLREHFFLIGPLLRWYSFYNETPPPYSWIWWEIPGGLTWLRGNYMYGVEVTDKLTETYTKDTF